MKKLILFISLFSFISNAQTVLTFEDDSFVTASDLIKGPNADEVSIVTDPTDASNKVLKIIYSENEWWDNHGGVTIPFTQTGALGGTFTFDIWTDHSAGTAGSYGYMLKLEGNQSGGGNIENSFAVAGAGSWQTITVDLADCTNATGNCSGQDNSASTFSKIFFFHWGGSNPSSPTPDTLYIDNVTYENGDVIPAPAEPVSEFTVDFETSSGFTGAAGATSFTEAGGYGTASQTNNDWWSNIQKTFDNPFDLSTQDRAFSMKIRGSRNSSITLKLEDSTNGGSNHEWRDDDTFEYDTPGQWKTLVFNASSLSNTNFDRVVIFFDIATDRPEDESTDTFDIDDVKFGSYAVLSSRHFEKLTNVNLYPNPATNFVNINSADTIDSYRIYDLTGRVVKRSSPYSNNFRIDVTSLNKGVYMVKLNSGDKTGSIKLIKDN